MPTDLEALLEKVKSPDATREDIGLLMEAAYRLSAAKKLDKETALRIVHAAQNADDRIRATRPWENSAYQIGRRHR